MELSNTYLEKTKQAIGFIPNHLTHNDIQAVLSNTSINALCYKSLLDGLDIFLSDIKNMQVKGDLIEIGAWKGGVACYMKALTHHLNLNKHLWIADTFNGFVSTINPKYVKDIKALTHFSTFNIGYPTVQDVKNLFIKNTLWDNSITILEGDVAITLPKANIHEIALLHIDVDFYEPTMNSLKSLYHKVSTGGYIIIDDYGVDIFNCREAVDDFRSVNNIIEPIKMLNDYIAYWKKE